MLPLIELTASALELGRAHRREGIYRAGFLRQWSEASHPKRPAVVFVPGFLTERDPAEGDELPWRDPFVLFGEGQDVATYVLHWPAGTLLRALGAGSALDSTITAIDKVGRYLPAHLMAAAAFSPTVLAAALGVASPVFLTAIATWKQAVSAADRVGSHPDAWVAGVHKERPVILVGHSLGGRIVLRATCSGPRRRARAVVALAPAIEQASINLNGASLGSLTKPTICHSENDWVLKYLFRLAEGTMEHAVGYDGAHHRACRDVDVGCVHGAEVGHHDYVNVAYHCLTRALTPRHLRDER
jgi:pimeloyl-ACP methyl ester carboxylesterase